MDEVFVEQIIKRRINASSLLLRIVSVLIVLLSLLMIGRLFMLGITISILLIYGTYLIWSYTSVEYEYSFLNGELSIDKILGQRKRKFVKSFEIKNAEVIAPIFSDEIKGRAGNMKTIDLSSGYKSDKVYAMIINDGNRTTQVLLEPDENVLNAMHHVRPNIVKIYN